LTTFQSEANYSESGSSQYMSQQNHVVKLKPIALANTKSHIASTS